MPYVDPPRAKTIIRMGIIHRSRPRSRATNRPMPVWIAPVRMVTPRKPPITMMKSATSMAPNRTPLL